MNFIWNWVYNNNIMCGTKCVVFYGCACFTKLLFMDIFCRYKINGLWKSLKKNFDFMRIDFSLFDSIVFFMIRLNNFISTHKIYFVQKYLEFLFTIIIVSTQEVKMQARKCKWNSNSFIRSLTWHQNVSHLDAWHVVPSLSSYQQHSGLKIE